MVSIQDWTAQWRCQTFTEPASSEEIAKSTTADSKTERLSATTQPDVRKEDGNERTARHEHSRIYGGFRSARIRPTWQAVFGVTRSRPPAGGHPAPPPARLRT